MDTGRHLESDSIRIIVDNAAKWVGIKKNVHIHLFRYTLATHMIEFGASMLQVRGLGNAYIISTKIYADINSVYLRSQVDTYHLRSRK